MRSVDLVNNVVYCDIIFNFIFSNVISLSLNVQFLYFLSFLYFAVYSMLNVFYVCKDIRVIPCQLNQRSLTF